jgi:hypothetical protein
MRMMLTVVAMLLGTTAGVAAEEPAPEPAKPPEAEPPGGTPEVVLTGDAAVSGGWQDISRRQQGSDDLVADARELEISSQMVFVTSGAAMTAGVPELLFTDVGLWRTDVAYNPLPRLRLAGSVELLAKQPSTIDEPFFQAAGLGVQFNTSARTALTLGVDVGSMMGDSGNHGGVGLGFQGRKRMNEIVSWEGRVGVGATQLWFDADTEEPFWFAEAGGSGEVQICWGPCERRFGATWFGIDLAVPVYHHPDGADARTGLELDPHTRLGFTTGSFARISKHWDMFVSVSWVDRGDVEKPETQLPILDGGFDQVQLGLGLTAHWRLEACKPGDYSPDCRDGDGW